ncbi:hypothetical protein Cob_v007521 [Colletotrichum orbiculare MAFF 240422]|uniref:Uncharacterized protein n=1 Tax=Colletotrichum orbiculare (strain 104-T / ATCC 96160 / CBS 514.97 / LARS 414 / MAFF 240422) TaxID=1213857 RepID=A0A484FPM1_COLOR|nr:hypothetical protein Cob_v007521 [Colletotrichum orbiculare MAFF 240422]
MCQEPVTAMPRLTPSQWPDSSDTSNIYGVRPPGTELFVAFDPLVPSYKVKRVTLQLTNIQRWMQQESHNLSAAKRL